MSRLLTSAVLACLLAGGPVSAQTAQDVSAAPAASAAPQSSVKLVGVVMALPAGTPWLQLKVGTLLCLGQGVTRTATGGRQPQELSAYSASFKEELQRAGYRAVTPQDNLFDPEAVSADYEVAGVITDAHFEGCISPGGFGIDRGSVRGEGYLSMDWQLYSPVKKQVVARVSTSGMAKLDSAVSGGEAKLVLEAFGDNVRGLAASADFRTALSAPKASTKGVVVPGQQSAIALSGSLKAGPRHIDDAVGDVVTLMTGVGSGSGVLLSDDGYMLTNAHVVGDDKTIRVRWSDGIETIAQVVRVARDRDIALIRTNPRDRTPLAIKRGAVTPGQRVYAIGSPKGKEFQGTVSSGVISANRVIDGMRYIQSDTSVSPGSSGGALLDEKGLVIGITVAGVENRGPAGLNLFIPIGDAMDFLSLEQH